MLSKRGSVNKKMAKSQLLWWDRECDEAIKKRNRAFRNFKKLPNVENLNIYRVNAQETRKFLLKKKKDNFRAFMDDVGNNFHIGSFWDTVSKFRRCSYLNLKSPSSSSKSDLIEVAVARLAPPYCSLPLENVISNTHCHSFFDSPISQQEVKRVIMNSSKNSAAGPDLISYWILACLPDIALFRLTEIFNLILTDGSFPESWHEFDTVLIPKNGRAGFRPISLASCTLKMFEKLIKRRLERFVELEYILPSSQYGFRRGMSCEHCLSIINLEAYKAFNERQNHGGFVSRHRGSL